MHFIHLQYKQPPNEAELDSLIWHLIFYLLVFFLLCFSPFSVSIHLLLFLSLPLQLSQFIKGLLIWT